jgi:predicted ribosome quality control (RQC) complex YloA/Tae2 family protein
VVHDLTAFRERLLHRPSSPLLQAVKFTFPTFGTILALEALHRAAIPAEAIAGDVSSDAIDTLLTRVPGLLHDLSHPSPRTYMTPHGTVKLFSPIALTHVCEPREVLFDDIHDAIRFTVYRRRSARGVDDRKEAVVSILREQLRRAQRSVEAIEQELATGSRATEYERFGTLILHHLHELTPGAESLDIQEGALQVSVPLEPRVPPTHSAQRYFERAKHARLAEQESRKRLAHLRSRISVAESLIADLSPAGTVDEFTTRLRRQETALQQFGLSQQGQPVELPPFRVFRVDGGFEVWAGKNSTNNDLLTLRYARPNDLWFHARGAGGSHVVLRVSSASGEPGRRAREQAAGIAAYYSKMRNARMVPVVVTERKFVRKPKGAPPGTVVLQREDVIFAEPRLPEGSPSSGS